MRWLVTEPKVIDLRMYRNSFLHSDSRTNAVSQEYYAACQKMASVNLPAFLVIHLSSVHETVYLQVRQCLKAFRSVVQFVSYVPRGTMTDAKLAQCWGPPPIDSPLLLLRTQQMAYQEEPPASRSFGDPCFMPMTSNVQRFG